MPRRDSKWGPGKRRRLTPKVKAFFAALAGEAKMNATEAARVAFKSNLKAAGVLAAEMKRKWPELFEKAEAEFLGRIRMSDEELDEHLSEISRDKQHKDRLRALELIARMKGRLNDKLQVTIDRKSMMKEIEQLLVMIPVPPKLPVEEPSEDVQRLLKPTN